MNHLARLRRIEDGPLKGMWTNAPYERIFRDTNAIAGLERGLREWDRQVVEFECEARSMNFSQNLRAMYGGETRGKNKPWNRPGAFAAVRP